MFLFGKFSDEFWLFLVGWDSESSSLLCSKFMVGLRVVGVDSSLDFIENETGAEIIETSDDVL